MAKFSMIDVTKDDILFNDISIKTQIDVTPQ
jgi:hypothetical protein